MRYAIYFTPPAADPLTGMAADWLGRDAFSGVDRQQPESAVFDRGEMAALTASPRRYGFHATMKAPFRLAPGESEAGLVAALESFAAGEAAFDVPSMRVGLIEGFFAIVPEAVSAPLNALAGRIVSGFDRFRAPLTADETARRAPDRLSPLERQNLADWGYPYVFDSFRFHMTLTERIADDRQAVMRAELERRFAPLLAGPVRIGHLAVSVEPEPGAPFRVLALTALAARG